MYMVSRMFGAARTSTLDAGMGFPGSWRLR
jgi:hypothetical protein